MSVHSSHGEKLDLGGTEVRKESLLPDYVEKYISFLGRLASELLNCFSAAKGAAQVLLAQLKSAIHFREVFIQQLKYSHHQQEHHL